MAIVRVSNKLLDSIGSTTRRMANAEVERIELQDCDDLNADMHSDLRISIETQAWSAAPDLRGQLPAEWLVDRERINTTFIVGEQKLEDSATFVVGAGEDKLVIPYSQKITNYWAAIDIHEANMTPRLLEAVKTKLEIKNEVKAVIEKYKGLALKLQDFVKSQASLNTALKAMPELAMYVDKEYIDRVNEVVEKKVKQKAEDLLSELDIDRGELAATAIAHRISGVI